MTAMEYIEAMRFALFRSLGQSDLYHGKDGAKRLAREVGYGLGDFPEKERLYAMQASYTHLCVMGYDLRPPLDANEWVAEMKKSLDRRTNKSRP